MSGRLLQLLRIVDALLREGAKVIADLGTAERIQSAVERWPSVDILVNESASSNPRGSRTFPIPTGCTSSSTRSAVSVSSSESALQIPVEMIHYGMSKTAHLAIVRGRAETTTGTDVKVNSILPD